MFRKNKNFCPDRDLKPESHDWQASMLTTRPPCRRAPPRPQCTPKCIRICPKSIETPEIQPSRNFFLVTSLTVILYITLLLGIWHAKTPLASPFSCADSVLLAVLAAWV